MKTSTTVGIAIITIVISSAATAGIFILAIPEEDPLPEVRVFMASSLASVVENYKSKFDEQYNCKLVINSGGSDSLYAQIVMGSPCDVFMAAAAKWTKQLNDSSLLYNYTGSCKNFTTNKLVVILPKDNPKSITSLTHLSRSDVTIAIGGPTVPVGSYTNTTILKINNTWGNSSHPNYVITGEYDNFYEKFYGLGAYPVHTSECTSVQYVVSSVAYGAGAYHAGIAYISDMTVQKSDLVYLEIPDEVNTIGTYGIGVMKVSKHIDLAQAFVNFWLSIPGQDLLALYGFGTTL